MLLLIIFLTIACALWLWLVTWPCWKKPPRPINKEERPKISFQDSQRSPRASAAFLVPAPNSTSLSPPLTALSPSPSRGGGGAGFQNGHHTTNGYVSDALSLEAPCIPPSPGPPASTPSCTTSLRFTSVVFLAHFGVVIITSLTWVLVPSVRFRAAVVVGFVIVLVELSTVGVRQLFRENKTINYLPVLQGGVLALWPFLLVFLDPEQPVHIGGIAMWGLVAQRLQDGNEPSPTSLGDHQKLSGILITACWVSGLYQFRSWGWSESEWFLIVQILLPCFLVMTSSIFPFGDTPTSLKGGTSGVGNHTHSGLLGAENTMISVTHSGATVHHPYSFRDVRKLEHENHLLKAKAGYVASLAHEVRTPLNALLSCCTLLGDTPLSGDQQELIDLMISSGSQITNNIDYVLEMARLENGQVTFDVKPFSVPEVCGAAVEMVRHLTRHKKLQLDVTCSRNPPVVLGDANRFRQVLLNLLTNSIKFTQEGSVSIEVTFHLTQRDPMLLEDSPVSATSPTTTSTNSCHLRISVSDTGIGMTPEQQGKLFQPFVQASEETWGKYGGSGLGLSISQKLICLMGGKLYIDPDRTRVGVGSTFVIEVDLPLFDPLVPTASSALSLTRHAKGDSRISLGSASALGFPRPASPNHEITRGTPDRRPPRGNLNVRATSAKDTLLSAHQSAVLGDALPLPSIGSLAPPPPSAAFMPMPSIGVSEIGLLDSPPSFAASCIVHREGKGHSPTILDR